jgi:6-phosphogluconate dehydrogenase (decarboxylating)
VLRSWRRRSIIKMVQNGIEYGITAGHAEWLRVLREANAGKLPRALNIGELRRRGGVIGQRPRTLEIRVTVSDSADGQAATEKRFPCQSPCNTIQFSWLSEFPAHLHER